MNFDFKNEGISVIEGSSFTKADLTAMYIENPFVLGVNISKNVSVIEVERLQLEMTGALKTLHTHTSRTQSQPWGIMGLFAKDRHDNKKFKVLDLFSKEDDSLQDLNTLTSS